MSLSYGPTGYTGYTGPQGPQGVTGASGVVYYPLLANTIGSSTNPSYSFSSYPLVGMYCIGGQLGLACSSTGVAIYGTTAYDSAQTIYQYNQYGQGVKVNAVNSAYADSMIWLNASKTGAANYRFVDCRGAGKLLYAVDGAGNVFSYGGLYYAALDEFPGFILANSTPTAKWYLYHNSVASGQNMQCSAYNDAGTFVYTAYSVYRNGTGVEFGNNIFPDTDNSYTCGKSGKRWSAIWSANGTIQTSDQRMKDEVADESLGLDFVNKLRPVSYKWKDVTQTIVREIPPNPNLVKKDEGKKDGDAPVENVPTDNVPADDVPIQPPQPTQQTVTIEQKHSRRHHGLIAQDVKAVMDELKLDSNDCAFYVDNTVNNPDETQQLGLNYGELIPILIKAVQELSAKQSDAKSGEVVTAIPVPAPAASQLEDVIRAKDAEIQMLNARIDQLNAKMDQEIQTLNAKMDRLFNRNRG